MLLSAVALTELPALQKGILMNSTLAELFAQRVPELNAAMQTTLAEHGKKPVDIVTVSTAYTGSRVQISPCETSRVHPETGVAYAGHPIATIAHLLPEEIFFLLLMGRLPEPIEKETLLREVAERSGRIKREALVSTLRAMPRETDPMGLFVSGLMVLGGASAFAKSYPTTHKKLLWQPALDDALTLIAQVGEVGAVIWGLMNGEDGEVPLSEADDLGARLADMLDPTGGDALRDLIRRHLVLHADHESGNVSAFTAQVVGSAHATPFELMGAAALGLSGPLHGRASEEAFSFVTAALSAVGPNATDAAINNFVRAHLAQGKVVPGFGHAVLTKIDPRAIVLYEYGAKLKGGGPQFAMAARLRELVPPLLIEQGKAKNPHPNVDAASGSLLATLGIDKPKFFTVLFTIARTIGVTAQAVINRALVLPLIRPESIQLGEVARLPAVSTEG